MQLNELPFGTNIKIPEQADDKKKAERKIRRPYVGSIFFFRNTNVHNRVHGRVRIRPKKEDKMTKDEIINALAEELAEMRHDRDLWKGLFTQQFEKERHNGTISDGEEL